MKKNVFEQLQGYECFYKPECIYFIDTKDIHYIQVSKSQF